MIDAIVLGLGGMGSAIAYELSRRKLSVLGLEQFGAAHDQGSSHGESRIIRKAYFEHPSYVPLVLRSYELWKELEISSGQKLLHETGCLVMASPKSPVMEGCIRSAKTAGLSYELLKRSEIASRYPFKTPHDQVGFYEPDGGYLLVEKCVKAMLDQATANGADLRFNQKIDSWSCIDSGVEVQCNGETFRARKLVLALGAWTGAYLKAENIPLSPKRVLMFWYQKGKLREEMPVYFSESNDGRWVYGFPPVGQHAKVAFHNVYEDCDPATVRRSVEKSEPEMISKYFKDLLPEAGDVSHAKVCMYTMTPDENFVLGPHPSFQDRVFLACGFSGHGFKFAPSVGETAANFVLNTKERFDLAFLNPQRFST